MPVVLRSDPGALRGHRRRNGHSVRTLAAAAGLSHAAIVRLEGGAVSTKPHTVQRIAAVLGVSITDIATPIDDGQEVPA